MLGAPLGSLPDWLFVGIVLGGVLAVASAVVFVVGVRLFPGPAAGRGGFDGGESRRRAEIRGYLSSIDEPYLEEHVVAGRPAAFYLPRRGVAITFDARDYFRFERGGVQAVLLEYEFPGGNLGSRLPFETPGPGHRGGDRTRRESRWRRAGERAVGTSSADSAFAALGLPTDASVEEVRAAYRERVKDAHPDHGGDVDAFRRLREAYAVARERAG